MWIAKRLSENGRMIREESAGAEWGRATIGGESAAAVTRGEERALPVYGPGGMTWLPRAGETVLVIKGGSGREERCVAAAAAREIPAGMEPGELLLSTGTASIFLHNDGRIELRGNVIINGTPYEG